MRKILDDLENNLLPSTTALDEECQAYLNVMLSRPEEVSAEVASNEYALQFPAAECIAATLDELALAEDGAAVLDNRDNTVSLNESTSRIAEEAIAVALESIDNK